MRRSNQSFQKKYSQLIFSLYNNESKISIISNISMVFGSQIHPNYHYEIGIATFTGWMKVHLNGTEKQIRLTDRAGPIAIK
jgi:hypothetical protein